MRLLQRSGGSDLSEKVADALSAVRDSADRATLLKASLIAGGAAALTAGSAAISSLRRRTETSS
jgi:hypothetical protein